MGFMKFQSKNQMKLNFVQVGGKKRFIHFFESLFVKSFKTSYLNSGQGEKHNKKMAKKKQIKKIDDHFFSSLKKQGKNWQKSRTGLGEALYKKTILFFFEFFLVI